MAEYSPNVQAYLGRLYDKGARRFACRADTPEQVEAWQQIARPALWTLIGLDDIQKSVGDHQVAVELGEPQDMGTYTRQLGALHSEPHILIPFWLTRT